MKTLYFDLSMGAAGDMLTAALYELLDDEGRKQFLDKINNAGIPGAKVIPEKAVKCGITGTHMKVLVNGCEESAGSHVHTGPDNSEENSHCHEDSDHVHGIHEHRHDHQHHHHHSHAHLLDIEHIINGLNIPDEVKKNAIEVYTLIAEAESHAHGVPVTDIHFHEVGTMDAVADVVAASLLIDMIVPESIEASYINVGGGHVHCAHGILPVPAPATAYILKDVPVYQGHIMSELCTPTGAALLKHYVKRFGSMPVMKVSAAGYGMGRKDFEQANCVRAFIGEAGKPDNDHISSSGNETVTELVCSVDDMTGESMGYAIETLFNAGALEAYTVPAYMKKSRPGMELKVLCRNEDVGEMVQIIFKHTTTIGIRESRHRRYTLDRRIEEMGTPYGTMRLKISEGYNVIRKKWEYDDIANEAGRQGVSIETMLDMLGEHRTEEGHG